MRTHFAVLVFVVTLTLTACAPAPAATPTLESTPVLGVPLPVKSPTPGPLPATAQAEKWKKYQAELARVLLDWYSPKYGFPSGLYKSAICEWDVFAHAPQIAYVWAYCSVPSEGIERDVPAVVYLNETGYAQRVQAPGLDTYWADVASIFPADVQKKFEPYTARALADGKLQEMVAHAKYRQTHPDEPPLIVLTSTPSP